MYAKPEKVWTAIIYVVEVLFWEPERCGDVCVIITCLTDRWFHKRALQLFINMAGRNKMSGISKLTPLIIFILYYFSCSASVSFSLDDLVTILWMLRKRIKDDDEQSIWFFYHHDFATFCGSTHSNYTKLYKNWWPESQEEW